MAFGFLFGSVGFPKSSSWFSTDLMILSQHLHIFSGNCFCIFFWSVNDPTSGIDLLCARVDSVRDVNNEVVAGIKLDFS